MWYVCACIRGRNLQVTNVNGWSSNKRATLVWCEIDILFVIQTGCQHMGLLPDTYNCGLLMHRECRERFPQHRLQRKPLVRRSRHASRHARHARALMHVGIANPRWRGKRSRHSRRMRNPLFYVSGKRPIPTNVFSWCCTYFPWNMHTDSYVLLCFDHIFIPGVSLRCRLPCWSIFSYSYFYSD